MMFNGLVRASGVAVALAISAAAVAACTHGAVRILSVCAALVAVVVAWLLAGAAVGAAEHGDDRT